MTNTNDAKPPPHTTYAASTSTTQCHGAWANYTSCHWVWPCTVAHAHAGNLNGVGMQTQLTCGHCLGNTVTCHWQCGHCLGNSPSLCTNAQARGTALHCGSLRAVCCARTVLQGGMVTKLYEQRPERNDNAMRESQHSLAGCGTARLSRRVTPCQWCLTQSEGDAVVLQLSCGH